MKLLKFYSNFKIKYKIFSISLLLLLIFCLIGIISYQFFTSMYEEEIASESVAVLDLSSNIIDDELSSIENLSFSIATDPFVQADLNTINRSSDQFNIFQAKTRLQDRIVNFANTEPHIASLQIIDLGGERYYSGFNTGVRFDREKLLSDAFQAEGASRWTDLTTENHIANYRLIRNQDNLSLDGMGYLIIILNMDTLVDNTLNFSPGKNFLIVNQEDIYYKSPESHVLNLTNPSQEIESGYSGYEVNGEEFLTTSMHSNFSELTYYHFLSMGEITKQSETIRGIMIVLFFLMLTISLLLSTLAAEKISRPIEDLSVSMKHVEKGDFDLTSIQQRTYHDDEIGQLHNNYTLMIEKINQLIHENYSKQLMIQETEYKALQAQINPHFLYNTLDSINWMAKMNQQHKIAVMVEALGNMMRNIISKKAAMITVDEELEIINHYITIQKHRYHDRLDFRLENNINGEKIMIPKLTIQPIVENAIQHGLEEMITSCSISLKLIKEGEDVVITIKDNGPGIPASQLSGVYNGEIRSKSSGIGLKNIRERLHMMFGEAYGVTITSEEGKGTEVTVRIPSDEE